MKLLIAGIGLFLLIGWGQWFCDRLPNILWDLSTPVMKVIP